MFCNFLDEGLLGQVLPYVAIFANHVPHVAIFGSALHCFAIVCNLFATIYHSFAICCKSIALFPIICNVLQRFAIFTYCKILQQLAGYGQILQNDAEYGKWDAEYCQQVANHCAIWQKHCKHYNVLQYIARFAEMMQNIATHRELRCQNIAKYCKPWRKQR